MGEYADATDQMGADLVVTGILRDDGTRYIDEDDFGVIRALTKICDSETAAETDLIDVPRR